MTYLKAGLIKNGKHIAQHPSGYRLCRWRKTVFLARLQLQSESWAWSFGGDGGGRPVAILTPSLSKLLCLKLSIDSSFSLTTERMYRVTSSNIFISHHIWNHCMWSQPQTESFSIIRPYLSTWSKPAKWEGKLEMAH